MGAGDVEGGIIRHKKSGSCLARYVVEMPKGAKRKAIYGKISGLFLLHAYPANRRFIFHRSFRAVVPMSVSDHNVYDGRRKQQ